MKLPVLISTLAVCIVLASGQTNRGVCAVIASPSLQNTECRNIKSCSSDLSAVRLTATACPRLPTPETFCSWTSVKSLLSFCGGDGDCRSTGQAAPPPFRPETASKARMCYDDCLRCYMPSQCASGTLNIPAEISPFPSGFSYTIAPRGDADCTNYFNSSSMVQPMWIATILLAVLSLFFL